MGGGQAERQGPGSCFAEADAGGAWGWIIVTLLPLFLSNHDVPLGAASYLLLDLAYCTEAKLAEPSRTRTPVPSSRMTGLDGMALGK